MPDLFQPLAVIHAEGGGTRTWCGVRLSDVEQRGEHVVGRWDRCTCEACLEAGNTNSYARSCLNFLREHGHAMYNLEGERHA